MPKLKGPSSVSRKCSKTEHLTITTDPARRGLRIRGQRSNNTISFLDGTAGSHAQKTTDANGTATFKIQCNSAPLCPGSVNATFSAPGHTAHITAFDCTSSTRRFRYASSTNVAPLVYAARQLAVAQGALEALTQRAFAESEAFLLDESASAFDSEDEELLADVDDDGS